MQAAVIKKNIGRSLLLLHFIGLGLSVGTRFANLVIQRLTSGGALPTLALGRDLSSELARSLVLPGFLMLIGSGIALTLLRYGRRPPLWVWIKFGLNAASLLVASQFVAPALDAARTWAHWSAAHDQLAPQFQASASQASLYGAIVFALFLLNIPVAVWKPRLPVGSPRQRVPKLSRAA